MSAPNNRGFGPWPDEVLALVGGAWRLDPFTRIVRWVPTTDTTDRDEDAA